MMSAIINAVRGALLDILQLATRLALPFALLVGFLAATAAIAYYRNPEAWKNDRLFSRAKGAFLWALPAFIAYVGWAVLSGMLPVAKDQIEWQESAESTKQAKIEAEPIDQYGPAVAVLTEKTYSRSLTLPPGFVSRIGSEGIGVLTPYLTDPTAENVLKMADTFKQSGQDVVFTRQVTRVEEQPLSFQRAAIQAKIDRRGEQAYDLEFQGTYTFKNPNAEAADVRFQFPVPQVGTMRDLQVKVDGQALPDPDERGVVEWRGRLSPNESKTSIVVYRVLGGRAWSYVVGSARRRVEDLSVAVTTNGQVRFQRSSLPPTDENGGQLTWSLANVITNQRIALVFPRNVLPRESFLQALQAMPTALVVFATGLIALASVRKLPLEPTKLATGLGLMMCGFVSSVVLANYVGFLAGVIGGCLLGVVASGWATRPLGWIAAALSAAIPIAFLSGEHTGLLILVALLVTSASTFWLSPRISR